MSWDFALVNVAAAIVVTNGTIERSPRRLRRRQRACRGG